MTKSPYILLPFFLGLLFLMSNPASAQESMLCVGGHWTEDEANLMMKEFRTSWDDLEAWEERAEIIRKGILDFQELYKKKVYDDGTIAKIAIYCSNIEVLEN